MVHPDVHKGSPMDCEHVVVCNASEACVPKMRRKSDAILTADLDTRIRAREEEEEERRRQKKERKKDKKVRMEMANLFVGALIGFDFQLLLSYVAH
jgi:F0F1-type ATP synthase assembly protein I